jgi:hypothetical protein
MAAHPDRLQVTFSIELRGGLLLAELKGREIAADMREFVRHAGSRCLATARSCITRTSMSSSSRGSSI